LTLEQVKAMTNELLEAQAKWLPQFKFDSAAAD
jgi:alpha-galactosidase/6-phospho-beta-glucosidase family protein